ncbi:MAG: tetratricopeptide repeat protein [Bacteroidales bacterium]|nr:tetratricopeptide repeat protein [Bacteroidales bacterium]
MKINNIHTTTTRFAVLLAALCLLFSCSTRKNTGINRAYHNMTSRFNVNFNGKEALKTGEADYQNLCEDNYITTLPIYVYPPKEKLSSIYPSMDRVIEKASKSIYKHSMFFKGKEYVKPIDDAYLMMGKAYFYKQDYNQAQRIFNYIISTHKDGNCVEEAMIWNARTSLRMGYFSQADDIINESKYFVQAKKSKKLNLLYAAAGAEYHLTAPDGDRETAIGYIDDVLANKPDKLFRTRMYFILGQLYELEEQPAAAHDYFMKVAKKSPDYEMEFNARMHLATNYDGSPAKRTQILKELNKMLAEEKNESFRDQIYYAMSEIDRVDEDTLAQIGHLVQSVAAYQNNDFQRTHSSLRVADLYFSQEKYPQAKAYYDTAMVSMPKNYPNYSDIKKKSAILTELVDNLQEVYVQDSLQRIAKMSEGERDKWVKAKIAEVKREKARREKEERDKEIAMQSALGYANYNNQLNNSGSSGKWYFYNSTLMSAGKTEFLRKWGSRKLEDNWRISNKQQISFEDLANMNNPNAAKNDTTEYDENGNPIVQRETDPEKERYYTQDLPLTEGAIDTSNQIIANSLYQAAIIYLDLLHDQPRGCETLEKFYTRFPDHELSPSVLFLLYLNYGKMNNGKAETPKNLILTKYADTDYARLIREPEYYQKLAEQNKVVEKMYETTYQDFTNKQWNKVIAASDEALSKCTDPALRSKFAYIRAVSIGQTQSKENYRSALESVLSEYGNQPVAELVRILLAELDPYPVEQPLTPAKTNDQNIDAGPFTYTPEDWHYVTMIVNVHKIKIMDLKTSISDFNKQYYGLQKLTINSFYINQDEQIVTISRFKNEVTAMDYYHAISQNEAFKANILAKNITVYAMSAANYSTFYKEKESRELYNDFFLRNYLKQEP